MHGFAGEGFFDWLNSQGQNNFLTTFDSPRFDDIANEETVGDDVYPFVITVVFNDVVEESGEIKKDGFSLFGKLLGGEYFLQDTALFIVLNIYP